MALGPAILLNAALDPRVQDVAGRLFNSVYSRIFKAGNAAPKQDLVALEALTPSEKILAERLQSIDERLAHMPTDSEMAAAFASLQAEIRVGQKRLWWGFLLLAVLNVVSIYPLLKA